MPDCDGPPKNPAPERIAAARSLYLEGVRVTEILKRTGFTSHQFYLWLSGGPPGTLGADGKALPPLPLRQPALAGERRLSLAGTRAALVGRLWRAADRQAAEIEARLASAEAADKDRERDARTLAVLARTVRELLAIDSKHDKPAREAEQDDPMPRDLDALRDALAARIGQLRAERAPGPAAKTATGHAAAAQP
jgi:hypothetical protein